MRFSPASLTTVTLRRRAAEEAAGLPAMLAAARDAARTVAAGAHARRRAGAGESFWQFRDYHPGDRPQDIDWRQSAKGDRVFVRQREWQTAQTGLFWCAGGPGMKWRSENHLPEKREAALIMLLAAATLMAEGGEMIGPLDARHRPARHDAAIDRLGEALLGSEEASLPSTHAPRGAAIILAGDFLQPLAEVETALAPFTATAGTGVLIQTLDPAEVELPYDGRVIFHAPEGGERYPAAQASDLRPAYAARMEEHRASLAALCHRFGWHYQLHRTDRPARETLAALWQALAPIAGAAR